MVKPKNMLRKKLCRDMSRAAMQFLSIIALCALGTFAFSALDGMARIVVADTGCGMPADVIAKIFEPFFTTKPHDRGTGIGMAVVQRMIDDVQGRIDVDSAPGQGTRMTMWLPLAEPGAFARVIESAAALAPAQRRQQRVQAHAAMRQRWMNSQDLADNRAMFNRALGKDE